MLKIEKISKTFNPGTIHEKAALQGLSLHLLPGDFVTVIGSNGAGKSTLLNAISGSFFTDSGSIYLDGRNITFLPEYQRSRQIGRLFQDPMRGSAPHMTIEENLSLAAASGGWLSHVTRAEKAAFREKLAQLDMGLENRMKQPVGLLSGGQRQALTLVMATFKPPKLLLLDEHTAALDPATAEKVLEITRQTVSENRITTLMVTHNMHQALELGNRTLMMDRGHINNNFHSSFCFFLFLPLNASHFLSLHCSNFNFLLPQFSNLQFSRCSFGAQKAPAVSFRGCFCFTPRCTRSTRAPCPARRPCPRATPWRDRGRGPSRCSRDP